MKLTLGRKLGAGFGVVLFLMALSGVLTYIKASSIKETQQRAMNVRVPTIGALKDLQRDLNQTQSKGRQVILAGNESERREGAKKGFDSTWESIEEDVSALEALSAFWSLQENRDRLGEAKKQLGPLREVQEAAMKRAGSSEHDAVANAGNEFADKATTVVEDMKKPLGEMADSFSVLIKQDSDAMSSETRAMTLTLLISTVLALGVGIFVAITVMNWTLASSGRLAI